MKVEFKVNEDYLLKTILSRRYYGEPNQDIERLFAMSEDVELFGRIDSILIADSNLGLLVKKTDKMIAPHKQTDEFRRIFDSTQTHLEEVKSEWDSNFDRTLEWMQQMTGLQFNGNYIVFITHPSVPNGRYLGNRMIGWTDKREFPNYSTVYIWHEIMHDKKNLGKGETEHSVIELLTDNELRWFLNDDEDKPLIGHDCLSKLRRDIFSDFWQNYLKLHKKDIKRFVEKVKREMSD